MGVVDEAIQDGVGIGGVTDDAVPGGYGKLAGDDGRSTAIAVLEDFEQIVTGLFVEGLEAPVVQDENLNMTRCALRRAYLPSPRASASLAKSRGTR